MSRTIRAAGPARSSRPRPAPVHGLCRTKSTDRALGNPEKWLKGPRFRSKWGRNRPKRAKKRGSGSALHGKLFLTGWPAQDSRGSKSFRPFTAI
jgi:hypothetical protein